MSVFFELSSVFADPTTVFVDGLLSGSNAGGEGSSGGDSGNHFVKFVLF